MDVCLKLEITATAEPIGLTLAGNITAGVRMVLS